MNSIKTTEKPPLKYTCILVLQQKAKVIYRKPSIVYGKLPEIYKLAETYRAKGDEEAEYIMLQRWVNTINWLRCTPEYRNDKMLKNAHINNQMSEVKKILADLNQRLDTQYKQLMKEKLSKIKSVEKMDVDDEVSNDSYMALVDGPINLPETPTRDPLVGDNEEIINCNQLYQLVQDVYNRYLIIDIRSKTEYTNSRILSYKCMNIPSSEIKPGRTSMHLQNYVSRDPIAVELFRCRGQQYVDITILLDWNTSSKTLTSDNPLNTLRNILENWDPGVKHKKITILDGGYAEWLTRYPAFTTNPIIAEPASNNVSKEILDDIEYPDWIHSDDKDSISKTRENKSNGTKLVNKDVSSNVNVLSDKILFKHADSELSNNTSSRANNIKNVSINLERIPIDVTTRKYNDNSLKLQHKKLLSTIKKTDIPAKPIVDRSNKPVTLDTGPSNSQAVLKLMRQLYEITKQKEALEQKVLELERTLFVQHGVNSIGWNDEEIHGVLKSLCSKLEEKQNEYKRVEDELDKYTNSTNIESIRYNATEESEKSTLELNLGTLKMRMKDTATERKKLRDRKSMKNDYKEASTMESENNVFKEPLKPDSPSMGGNLERSYSSPNLLQFIDHKAPRVDRSSKPQVPSYNQNGSSGSDYKISHHSWANCEERMTPVHGSVHPGITGLKNLGNSCYMNSIIQCLSNTTQLAKYFTDNLYTDDLNTNDDSTQGQVVEEVAQVIKALWRGQYKSISPHDLKIAVGQYKLQFDSYEQQDSHEFLTFLLDWMHNDLKKNCKAPLEMTVAEEAWHKAMGSQKSIISDLFFGQLRSTITCSFCKQSSTTYETFNSLTTSLPHSNRCTLSDCILRFVTGQKVVGWKCPKCQTPREAMKKFDFVKLAPVIVIHLNRFAESGGWLEKRNTAVDFPLTGFNLKPYLVMDANTPANMHSYNYSLYAMSNHYGTMEGGHYTAFCKNAAQNKWYKYDDHTVTEVPESQVRSQNTSAYLLFYTSFSSNII
ncbi:ubiquitin carboxyl-terminal hydrolase 8-like isoform X1 [Hylaeus anthracinus]|uniref:ubiquitin carboxyl-terminal hydrolase 8-like isoform X1 n=1 Tax=Hylaeus anthracinus TaxID=313031 RepID=UPI0023B897D6|nr:ubiquitin carboxyl-terminal hydrolase 8-like isoform X1 [Hylaeus anthracinus]